MASVIDKVLTAIVLPPRTPSAADAIGKESGTQQLVSEAVEGISPSFALVPGLVVRPGQLAGGWLG